MNGTEKVQSGFWSGSRILIAGVAVLVLGVGPLLLYALVGPADGNPIGLGLLAMLAVPAGGILTGLGLIKMAIEWLAGRQG